MKLFSFVGVDIYTDLNTLDFGNNVELSVLYSETQSGKRYPNYEFCKKFLSMRNERECSSSIHFCGQSTINKFLRKDTDIMILANMANRVQLNYNISNFTDLDQLEANLIDLINDRFTIILQENKSKAEFNKRMIKYNRFDFLHDSSGGFGRTISNFPETFEKNLTGYAGGIGPNNIKQVIESIDKNNPNNYDYYVDMESGIRVDNQFSIDLCKKVIENSLSA